MSIFSKPKSTEPRVTYESFELPMEEAAPEPMQATLLTVTAPVRATSEWVTAGREPTVLLIAADSEIEGTVRSQGVVQVEGVLRGEVHAPKVLVAVGGRVEGTIRAQSTRIKGILKGAVVAHEIDLDRTASVEGELTYDDISIERGARVRGVHRQRDPDAATASTAATAGATASVPAGLATEAEAALQGLAEAAHVAARAATDLATDGIRGLAELEAELRGTGSKLDITTVHA